MTKLTKTKVGTALRLMLDGPRTGAEIAEAVDDITPCVARMMAEQRHRGRVVNLRPGNGKQALYAITPAGRSALAEDQSS